MENKYNTKNFKCILCQNQIKDLNKYNLYSYEYYVEGAGPLCEDCYNKSYPA